MSSTVIFSIRSVMPFSGESMVRAVRVQAAANSAEKPSERRTETTITRTFASTGTPGVSATINITTTADIAINAAKTAVFMTVVFVVISVL